MLSQTSHTKETQFSSGVSSMHYIVFFLSSISLSPHLEKEATNKKLKATTNRRTESINFNKNLKQWSKKEAVF